MSRLENAGWDIVRLSRCVAVAAIAAGVVALGGAITAAHILLAGGIVVLLASGILVPAQSPRIVGSAEAQSEVSALPDGADSALKKSSKPALASGSHRSDALQFGLEYLKDVEWELRDNESRYRDLLDSQTDIILRQGQDGTLIFVNKAFCRTFDVSAADIIGRSFTPNVLENGSDEDLGHRELADTVEAAPLRRRFVQQIATVSGPRWFSWEEQSVRSGETGALETQRIGRDVTEQRQVEATLNEARQQAEAASDAKSRFLAVMSHEIRTPLGGIMGMTGLLEGTQLTAEQRTYATAVKDSAKSLLSIIDEILDFSKIEAGKLTFERHEFELDVVLQSIAELLAPRAWDKQLELGWHIDPELPRTLLGDEQRIRQILMNLVGNAIKFTSRGGVFIRVRRSGSEQDLADDAPPMVPAGHAGHVSIAFDVVDTGIGLTSEQRKRIFTEFEQADTTTTRKFGGTGLGLTISRRLARSMHGDIVVNSRRDAGRSGGRNAENKCEETSHCGSIFTLSMPFPVQKSSDTVGDTWARAISSDPVVSGSTASRNVLIASDRGIEVDRIRETLEAMGHHVSRCDPMDATAAIKSRAALGTVVDAVIMDTQTHRAIRSVLCSTLREIDSGAVGVRALIIIEPSDKDRLSEFREEGFDAYLMRPVRPSSLLSQLLGGSESSGLPARGGKESWRDPAAVTDNMAEHTSWQREEAFKDGGAGVNILLAEDNPINALLATKILQDMGHSVIHVENGEEAAEAIAQTRVPCNPRFDVVLMDLHMPVLDGIAACERIKAQHAAGSHADELGASPTTPLPPIIALTANAFPEDRQRCLAAGMSDFVTKPFEREHLARVIDEWCNGGKAEAGDGSLTELKCG